MTYVLYNLLLAAAAIVGAPVWIAMLALRPKWRAGIWERLGWVPRRLHIPTDDRPRVWLHAVSVGEVLAAEALIRALDRDHSVFISTTTRTAQDLARKRFGAGRVFYFPLDLPFAVQRYLKRIAPRLVVVLETEFWPNFLRLAHRRAKVAVVNARISDRSMPGYLRRQRELRTVLRNVDLFAAQSELDADRLEKILGDPLRVRFAGNLKYDWSPPTEPQLVAQLRSSAGARPIIVAGSTVDGEEPLLLQSFEQLRQEFPDTLLILAPRHPERFDDVARALADNGVKFIRRSQWSGSVIDAEVVLLDSIGELASIYQLAAVTFVGGSLVPRGGHNILEPAYFGKAITIGIHSENFRALVSEYVESGAVLQLDAQDLGATWLQLLRNSELRERLGAAARSLMAKNSGATERTLALLRGIEKGEAA